jgi:hypothetical protein
MEWLSLLWNVTKDPTMKEQEKKQLELANASRAKG